MEEGGGGGGGGARRRLGVGAQLLVAGQIAGGVPGRTGEPVARLGQDLLLLPAVVANPDHLRIESPYNDKVSITMIKCT